MGNASLVNDGFNELYYLEANPDVADAVEAGIWLSGRHHFENHGRKEGRSPLPPTPKKTKPASQRTRNNDATESAIPPGTFSKHNMAAFLNPTELSLSKVRPDRIAMIGSCLLESWDFHKKIIDECSVDVIAVNNAGELPEWSNENSYDLQIIQIPFRAILFDASLWQLPYADIEAHEKVFEDVIARLEFHLLSRMEMECE